MVRIEKHGLQVDETLAAFLEQQALPGTGVDRDAFWKGFSEIVHVLGPKNRALLDKRAEIKGQIDAWHIERRGRFRVRISSSARAGSGPMRTRMWMWG